MVYKQGTRVQTKKVQEYKQKRQGTKPTAPASYIQPALASPSCYTVALIFFPTALHGVPSQLPIAHIQGIASPNVGEQPLTHAKPVPHLEILGPIKRRKWYLGIQSKKEPGHVMTEVLSI